MSNEVLMSLTTEEEAQREQLENTISEVTQQAYIIIGKALIELNEKKLYKSTHRTFADYALDVLDIVRRRAYQYMDAVGITVNIVSHMPSVGLIEHEGGDNVNHGRQTINVNRGTHFEDVTCMGQSEQPIVPQNERQARELAGLTSEEQVNIWQQVIVVVKEGEKLTAKLIREKVSAYKESKFKNTRKKIEQRTTTVDEVAVEEEYQPAETQKYNKNFRSEEMQAAWKAFFDQVDVEKKAKWRNTSRSALHNDMMVLLDVIGHIGGKELKSEGCSMELSDREKLVSAGFRIFRMVPNQLLIQEWRKNEWEYVSGFDSHKKMLDNFNALVLNERNLRG